MLDDSLRRRLETLNRGPLPGRCSGSERSKTGATKESSIGVRRRDPVGSASHRMRPAGNLLEQGEEVETRAGKHLRIVQTVEAVWRNGERLVAARHSILKKSPRSSGPGGSLPTPGHLPEDCTYRRDVQALIDSFPDRTLYLDLETCGLAGAALFLVGLLRRIDGELVIELLLARNYAEEKAVLVSLWERAAMHDVLVTFNGKSFDWPMVHDRSTRYLLGVRSASPHQGQGPAGSPRTASASRGGPMTQVTKQVTPCGDANPLKRVPTNVLRREDPRPELVHVDILHHARRRWRGRLPDCKLQTLERYICGRRREGDIPGALIPAAYQRFVETGEPREMESILFHNALDLVTLLDLSMRLAGDQQGA